MNALLLILIVLSLLLLGAHFYRAKNWVMIGVVVALLGLLFVRKPWAAGIVQGVLFLGVIEWIWTLIKIYRKRARMGKAATRMSIIILVVALVTLLSALAFEADSMQALYGVVDSK